MRGVYKYECAGEVIYVGKTDSSFSDRIKKHSFEKKFAPYLDASKIYVCEIADERECDFIETLLINQYRPMLNNSKKSFTSVCVSANVEWVEWEVYSQTEEKVEYKAYSLYLSEEMMTKVDALAKEKRLSKSRIVEDILREKLG